MKLGWVNDLVVKKPRPHAAYLARYADLNLLKSIGEFLGDMRDYRRLYFASKLKRKQRRPVK